MLWRFADIIGVSKLKCKTPGTPGFNIICPVTEEEQVSYKDQVIYRAGVETLLYLIKYSRPDIANVVRELSKCMDKATPAAYKEMKRVMCFIADTKDYGLKIEPEQPSKDKFNWNMVVYTDSDWAGDKEDRHSFSGYVIFLLDVPILWKSKSQKSVPLSSSEAEYFAMSEAVKDVHFIVMVLESLGIRVQTPGTVMVDNIGAIFMAENVSATSRTKRIDTQYHFVREFVEEGFIRVIFVRTTDNRSDMLTKNVSGEAYNAHIDNYIVDHNDIACNG
jgi:hypothetical protein